MEKTNHAIKKHLLHLSKILLVLFLPLFNILSATQPKNITPKKEPHPQNTFNTNIQHQLNTLLYASNIKKNLSNNNVEKVSENLQNLNKTDKQKLLNPALIIEKLLESLTIPTNQWETILLKQHITQAIHPLIYILYHTTPHYNKTRLQNQIQKAQTTINETKAPQNALHFHLDFLQAIIDNLPKNPQEQNETKTLIIATHQLLQQTKNDPASLAQATKDIHLHLKKKPNTTWYQIVLYINHLKQQTQNNPIALTYLQEILENYKKPSLKPQNKITQQINNLLDVKNQHHHNTKGNWHILYAGIDTLTHMAIHTPNLQTYLKTPHNILHYLNIQNQQQLSHPAYNWRLREKILESAILLTQHTNLAIKQQAIEYMLTQTIKEKNKHVTNILQQPSLITAITETLQKNEHNTAETFEKILEKHTKNIEQQIQQQWNNQKNQYEQNLLKQKNTICNISHHIEQINQKTTQASTTYIKQQSKQHLAILNQKKYELQEQLDTPTIQNAKLAKQYNNLLATQQTIANIHNNPKPTPKELKKTLQTIQNTQKETFKQERLHILHIGKKYNTTFKSTFLYNIIIVPEDPFWTKEFETLYKEHIERIEKKPLETLQKNTLGNILKHYTDLPYIPLKASNQHTKNFDVDQAVHTFLKTPTTETPLLVITGDSGSGKTTYLNHLCHKLWKTRKPNDPIPLLLHLKEFIPNINKNQLLNQGFNNYGIGNDDIEILQKKYKLILLLDGYDEIKPKPTLYLNWQLKWVQKIIVTTRKEHNINQNHFIPPNNNIPQQLYQEITLQPFDQTQINNYLQNITKQPNTKWKNWKQYRTIINQMSIQNIAKNPLALEILVYILPQATSKHKNNNQPPNKTNTTIYNLFTTHWFERNNGRLLQRKIEAINIAEYQEFAEVLASQMLQREKEIIIYIPPLENMFENTTSNPQQPDVWHKFFNPKDKKLVAIREGMPLRKIGNNSWTFIHKSLLEYFGACHIFSQASLPIQITLDNNNNPIKHNLYINKKLLNNQPGSIQFIADMAQKNTTFKQRLLLYIETSKKDPNIAIAAANSATILAMADINLNKLNWQGIRIPGANLDYAFLANTNFSNSDCRNVSLRQTYLENTIWNNAQVQNINFGEYPYLQYPYEVKEALWSPKENILATSSGNIIYLHSWDENNKINTQTHQHPDSIRSINWSPDGTKITLGGGDSTSTQHYNIHIWDIKKNIHITSLESHTEKIWDISYSPDGTKIASASWDNTIYIWDGTTAKLLTQCIGHTHWVTSVTWSPDSKKIASASCDNTVRIWDSTNAKLLHTCKSHTWQVNDVKWSPDSTKIASGSKDKTLCTWNPHNGTLIKKYPEHKGAVEIVTWSKDSKKLISVSSNIIYIWEAHTHNLLGTYTQHTDEITSISLANNNSKMTSVSTDNTLHIWDINTQKTLIVYQGHKYSINTVQWSPDNTKISTASPDKTVHIWDSNTSLHLPPQGHTKHITSVKWSPDSKKIASASKDNTIRIWNSHTAHTIQTYTKHTDDTNTISWSPNGTKIASGSSDKTIHIWNPHTAHTIRTYTQHTDTINTISWSPNGKKIASGSNDNTVHIWNPTTGKTLNIYTQHKDNINAISWSPNSTKIASASWDNTIHIWNASDGILISKYTGHTGWVTSVNWSPDGIKIASGSENTIHIWNATHATFISKYTGHTNVVTSVSWSPDGKKIASASCDKTLHIWDNQCTQIAKCTGHIDYVKSVHWSPDSTKIATGSWDNTIRIWDANNGHLFMILGSYGLNLHKAQFINTLGLTSINKQLIKQRGGTCKQTKIPNSKKEEEKEDCLIM